MEENVDWKRFEFVTFVQTVLINHATKIAALDARGEKQDLYGGGRTLTAMHQVMRAACRIPKKMSASDAADEFCRFLIYDQECPSWAAEG